MKIFKTVNYPTRQKFLTICERYKIHLRLRGAAARPVKPRPADEQTKKYVAAVLRAERLKKEPPEIEWINLTAEEVRKKEIDEKRREEQKKREEERERKKAERRAADLQKAASDPDFKRLFMRAELSKEGISIERMVEEMVAERHDGQRNQEFWQERRRVQERLEDEIRQANEG